MTSVYTFIASGKEYDLQYGIVSEDLIAGLKNPPRADALDDPENFVVWRVAVASYAWAALVDRKPFKTPSDLLASIKDADELASVYVALAKSMSEYYKPFEDKKKGSELKQSPGSGSIAESPEKSSPA